MKVMCLKNPMNGCDTEMCEVIGKMGLGEPPNMTIHKLMINEHETICIGVSRNNSVQGWKLSWWSWRRMHNGGAERRLTEKRGDNQLLCHPLHVVGTPACTLSTSIFEPYEKCPVDPFEEAATNYTANFCTWHSMGPDVSPDFVFTFHDDTNHGFVFHNGIQKQQYSPSA